ncbi:MAG: hypothetical protein H7210_00735 [Pyrinomonadaceae bacterium]|nr:hypothetical protein [Phycisphaerales bacterium]
MSVLFLASIDGSELFLGGGVLIAVLAILCGTLKSILETRQREQSRREIAAYIAEGSMTPDDGAKILTAEGKKCG